jgi:hypothetical protein
MRITKEQLLMRRVKILKSHTSWVNVGTIGVVVSLPKFGGLAVRIVAQDVQYPPGSSHPHVKHEFETFYFKVTDVELIFPEVIQ